MSIPREAIAQLRRRTGAPFRLVLLMLRKYDGDVDRAVRALADMAIDQLRERTGADPSTARSAYARFGWDVEAGNEWIVREREAPHRRRELAEFAINTLENATRVAELFVLGQCDAPSTEPEKTVYYIAGFYRGFDRLPLFVLDCPDKNQHVVKALEQLGETTLCAEILHASGKGMNDRHSSLEPALVEAQHEVILRMLRAYVRDHRQSFRVLAS